VGCAWVAGCSWVPHWAYTEPEGGATKIRVLPPRTDRFIEMPEQVRNQMHEVSDSVYAVSIEFIDAAGNRWERDPRERSFSAPDEVRSPAGRASAYLDLAGSP
jgi:hypothetical protein